MTTVEQGEWVNFIPDVGASFTRIPYIQRLQVQELQIENTIAASSSIQSSP